MDEYGDTYEVITITDEDGEQLDFFVIDAIDIENKKYLLVVSTQDYDEDEPEASILKEVSTEGDDIIYEFVEDDNEYNKALILFQDNDGDYEMEF